MVREIQEPPGSVSRWAAPLTYVTVVTSSLRHGGEPVLLSGPSRSSDRRGAAIVVPLYRHPRVRVFVMMTPTGRCTCIIADWPGDVNASLSLFPVEHQLPRQFERFELDAQADLAAARVALLEVDRDLHDLVAQLLAAVVHLDLEAESVAADVVQVDRFQHRTAPQLETAGGVADAQPHDRVHVRAAAPRQQPAVQPPLVGQ